MTRGFEVKTSTSGKAKCVSEDCGKSITPNEIRTGCCEAPGKNARFRFHHTLCVSKEMAEEMVSKYGSVQKIPGLMEIQPEARRGAVADVITAIKDGKKADLQRETLKHIEAPEVEVAEVPKTKSGKNLKKAEIHAEVAEKAAEMSEFVAEEKIGGEEKAKKAATAAAEVASSNADQVEEEVEHMKEEGATDEEIEKGEELVEKAEDAEGGAPSSTVAKAAADKPDKEEKTYGGKRKAAAAGADKDKAGGGPADAKKAKADTKKEPSKKPAKLASKAKAK